MCIRDSCVDSILNQEFRDFELILMDDGSKDRSGEICDGYARADARVVVAVSYTHLDVYKRQEPD